MGRRGPLSKNPKLKLLRGNPGGRKIQEALQIEAAAPECPARLTGAAKLEWFRVVPALNKLGIICPLDEFVLMAYCEYYAEYCQLREIVAAEGCFVRLKNGCVQRHPAMIQADRDAVRVRQFCRDFGMTPDSRLRMNLPGQPAPAPGDSYENFRRGKPDLSKK